MKIHIKLKKRLDDCNEECKALKAKHKETKATIKKSIELLDALQEHTLLKHQA